MTDVILTESGDLPKSPQHGSPNQVLLQRLRFALNKWRGENPVDQTDGMPFREWMNQKPVDTDAIRAFLIDYLEDIKGVESVDSLTVTLNKTSRKINIEGALTAEDVDRPDLEIDADILVSKQGAGHVEIARL